MRLPESHLSGWPREAAQDPHCAGARNKGKAHPPGRLGQHDEQMGLDVGEACDERQPAARRRLLGHLGGFRSGPQQHRQQPCIHVVTVNGNAVGDKEVNGGSEPRNGGASWRLYAGVDGRHYAPPGDPEVERPQMRAIAMAARQGEAAAASIMPVAWAGWLRTLAPALRARVIVGLVDTADSHGWLP